MFAAATSFFARTAISQSYNIGGSSSNSGSRSSTPGPAQSPGPSNSTFSGSFTPTVPIGLWKVQSASHKVTNKRVSVWSFDKRSQEMERLGPMAKDRTLEVLKAEASALGRLRHPSILEMVEPLEETRNELIFATEPILASLELAIPSSGRFASLVELDEVEIQKGILQICKGLSFLHSSAQLIHSNICPESIIVNSSGDWKISGLGLTIPLLQPNGTATRWEFPTFDGRVPAYIQRSFDYMAPEYALDEQLVTASDMYSLGCVMYAVHCKGSPPFKTHDSLGGLRECAGRPVPGMDRLDPDLQSLLRALITRHHAGRPTPTLLPSQPFFSSLPISTLSFLDRSTFTAKTREEKISFMKGLAGVLDKFSDGLKTRKILPSLLEEMKDTHLLPYILPNVFAISSALSATQFASLVLPSLKPLFVLKEPPANMLTLLDNLTMLQSKTERGVFRTEVLPLVYNALESEHGMVQERALKTIPDLCDTIDYAEVRDVTYQRVANVFSSTRILTVKVATLATFLSMVKVLDQSTLTQKLVPMLANIRTKQPAVMMATLSVHEAMGAKVDREAVATLVLPQLWAMSMGPLLNVTQFQRFMAVIRQLADRVEKEHNQFLRDSQRIEDMSATAMIGSSSTQAITGSVDFENLVGRGAASSSNTQAPSLEDDPWGSIFNDTNAKPTKLPNPIASPVMASSPPLQAQSLPSSPKPSSHYQPSRLNPSTQSTSFTNSPVQRSNTGFSSVPTLQPTNLATTFQPAIQQQKPNYNISLPTSPPSNGFPPVLGSTSINSLPLMPPMMGNMLTPSKPSQPSWGSSSSKPSKDDWGDFDPLL
ncbi:hypothetical protein D9758_001726 [Tetrapyrgos nigripes]|uniref:Protein kinase domain-containing protein n=1 Tax=Tetrapyrgos nigripes TaxID=182062 RepID=A0A8H5LWX0_9AGAR|nr:hypothetical protein D9758_001726 [Tetrapyrgos nigripes]